MTPEEYEKLTLKMRLLAAERMVGWLSHSLGAYVASLPIAQKSRRVAEIREALSEQQKRYAPLTVKRLDPAESDMYMGLFQEAFDEFSKEVVRVVEGSSA